MHPARAQCFLSSQGDTKLVSTSFAGNVLHFTAQTPRVAYILWTVDALPAGSCVLLIYHSIGLHARTMPKALN